MQPSIARLVCVGLIVLSPAAGDAQELAGSFDQLRVLVKAGDQVTLTDGSGSTVRGSIAELSSGSLTLVVDGRRRSFLERDVHSIAQRRPDSLANGARWGFAVGAGLGVLAGIALTEGYDGGGEALIPLLALAYGGMGAGTGAGLDAMISGRRVIYAQRGSASKVSVRPVLTSDRRAVVAAVGF